MVGPKKTSLLFCTVLAVLLGASAAMASPIPCVNGSLALYAPLTNVSADIACQYQDLIFTFSFGELQYQADPSQPPLAPGDRIENHVSIAFITTSPGVEGLLLSPTDYPWLGLDGNTSDVNFTYTVDVATPLKFLTRGTFAVTATVTGPSGGGVLAAENICCPDGTSGSPSVSTLTVNQFSTGTGIDSQPFGQAVQNVGVNKDLLIFSNNIGDQANITSFSQTFNVGFVPEPGVLVLTGGGLLGLLLLSRRKLVGKALSAILLFCMAAVGAHASPICTSVGSTLNLFIAAGSCDISGTTFTFGPTAYAYSFSGGVGIGHAVAASAVNVNVLTSPANPGFQFVAQWAVSAGQTGDLTLQFTATAPSSIRTATFNATTSKSGAGTVGGSSTVTNGVPPIGYVFPPGGVLIKVLPAVNTVTLTGVVNLKGNGTAPTDNAHLSNLVVTASSVPEPVTAIFLGSGLIGLALIGRKRLSDRK
jgi:hypothetical protein